MTALLQLALSLLLLLPLAPDTRQSSLAVYSAYAPTLFLHASTKKNLRNQTACHSNPSLAGTEACGDGYRSRSFRYLHLRFPLRPIVSCGSRTDSLQCHQVNDTQFHLQHARIAHRILQQLSISACQPIHLLLTVQICVHELSVKR